MNIQGFFSGFDVEELCKITLTLFTVIDIVGTTPLIMRTNAQGGRVQPMKTTVTVAIFGFLFLLLGESILWVFDLDFKAFRATGGVVIFLLGLELVFDLKISKIDNDHSGASSIVPLGFPIIAGAGTLTTLVIMQEHYHMVNIILGFCLNLVSVYVVIRYVHIIQRRLGNVGVKVISKLVGILMISMGIQLIKDGFFQK